MQRTILCDVDGVLYPLVPSFMECYVDAGGQIPEGYVHSYWDSLDDLPNKGAVTRAWTDPRLMNNRPPIAGALEGLYKMSLTNAVYLVTAISWMHAEPRVTWLKNYAPWFPLRRLILAKEKQLIHGDILIEDHGLNLIPWMHTWRKNGGIGILMAQPWNEEYHTQVMDIGGYIYHGTLDEMYTEWEYLFKGE